MAKLILSMDGLVLKEIELDKERVTIGRRPCNDVQINNLAISGEHAAVVTILNDSFLEDLNSTNGTLVNGKSIKKRVLHHNDVITMGKYTLKFLNDPKEKKADEKRIEIDAPSLDASSLEASLNGGDANKRGASNIVSSGLGVANNVSSLGNVGAANHADATSSNVDTTSSIGTATAFRNSADTTETARKLAEREGTISGIGAMAVLHILSGSHKGKELPLFKAITSLGKPGVQVANILLQPQGYMLQHVEGAQTPIVNGQAIGNEPWPLSDGEEIEIYGVHMRFMLKF